ncbi:hypothetical protein DRZ77_00280 [Candidatus Woesearchaeota archaeon]|nr:MAG: hypothetical protein DRZ77_00280 [Candidatus Woesearchaeota archaeon]
MGKRSGIAVVIGLNQINDELNKHYENVVSKIEKRISNLENLFSNYVDSLAQMAEQLRNAEIKLKIDEKTKSIVISQRENYLKHLNLLIEQLKSIKLSNVDEFAKGIFLVETKLNAFFKSAVRSRELAKHLFFDEIEGVDKALNFIRRLIENSKAVLEENNVLLFYKLREKYEAFKSVSTKRKEVADLILDAKKKLVELGREKESLEHELEALKHDPKFSEFTLLQKENDELEYTIERLKSKTLELFSPIQRPLRKFSRIVSEKEDIKLIEAYLRGPFDALISDEKLRILKLLADLKRCVSIDQIDLKDKKKETVFNNIEKINFSVLNSILEDYKSICEKKTLVKKKLYNNQITLRKKEIQYRLEYIDAKIREEKEKLLRAEERKKRLDEEFFPLKREFENDLGKFLGKEVTISF